MRGSIKSRWAKVCVSSLIVCFMLLSLLSEAAEPATDAIMGMPQIRYELYKDSNADVYASLQSLASKGVVDAQFMLAELLSGKSGYYDLRQTINLYKKAFREGRGSVHALGMVAHVSSKFEWLAAENKEFISDGLKRFEHDESLENVSAVLEAFFAYPSLVKIEHVGMLLPLYSQACLDYCYGDLFEAKYQGVTGNASEAERLYALASRTTSRAVNAYYDYLDGQKDRDQKFKQFASGFKYQVEQFSVESMLAIGSRLKNISKHFDGDVIFWFDAAIELGSVNAKISKVEYMLSQPADFSLDEASNLIEQIMRDDHVNGLLLQASLFTVSEWKRLDPHAAFDILIELSLQGHQDAYVGLGDLYSMGGLDEVDQQKAISAYLVVAKKGSSAAFQKIANIYRNGRSICQDNSIALAYGKMAMRSGEEKSKIFISSLEKELDASQLSRAEKIFGTLLEKYLSAEFE